MSDNEIKPWMREAALEVDKVYVGRESSHDQRIAEIIAKHRSIIAPAWTPIYKRRFDFQAGTLQLTREYGGFLK